MDNDGQGPSRNAGKPDWFLTWLKKVFLPLSKDPVASQIELFEDTVEKIPDINNAVKVSLTNALTKEARISLGQEDDKSKVSLLIKLQSIPTQESSNPMPWDQLTEIETKSIAKIIKNLKEQDFSTKSLKHWAAFYVDKFDRCFIHTRVGRIA